MDVNVKGMFLMCKAVLPGMLTRARQHHQHLVGDGDADRAGLRSLHFVAHQGPAAAGSHGQRARGGVCRAVPRLRRIERGDGQCAVCRWRGGRGYQRPLHHRQRHRLVQRELVALSPRRVRPPAITRRSDRPIFSFSALAAPQIFAARHTSAVVQSGVAQPLERAARPRKVAQPLDAPSKGRLRAARLLGATATFVPMTLASTSKTHNLRTALLLRSNPSRRNSSARS